MSYSRDWINNWKGSNGMVTTEFINGVQMFLNFAFTCRGYVEKIKCPCTKCKNWKEFDQDIVATHLYSNGFMSDYYTWIYHEESFGGFNSSNDYEAGGSGSGHDYAQNNNFEHYRGMVTDHFQQFRENLDNPAPAPNAEAKHFYDLIKQCEKPVYRGHDKSILQWVSEVMNSKTTYNESQSAMDDHIQQLRDMAPREYRKEVPKNYREVKDIISKLGIARIKYDVCIKDCFLYYWDGENALQCPSYGVSRFKEGTTIAQKKLWYFPITPRLQRLYMSLKTAEKMTWHEKCKNEDERLIHPAGGQAWKHFDQLHPSFAAEPRIVRLGLCTDGFNPYRGSGTQYSCWPVFVTPYNLPPTLAMRPEFIFLSLIIAGPKGPRVNSDVMLRPLIDELKELWHNGALTWDCKR